MHEEKSDPRNEADPAPRPGAHDDPSLLSVRDRMARRERAKTRAAGPLSRAFSVLKRWLLPGKR